MVMLFLGNSREGGANAQRGGKSQNAEVCFHVVMTSLFSVLVCLLTHPLNW
jgi:hypothetical protein